MLTLFQFSVLSVVFNVNIGCVQSVQCSDWLESSVLRVFRAFIVMAGCVEC